MIRTSLDAFLRRFERQFATHNRIEVSRAALLHNVDLIRKLTGKQVIAVLKANAYGHGIAQVATALKSAKLPYIAVDGYFEALKVRQVCKTPVLIMGAIRTENFAKLRYDDFAFVVQDAATVRALGKTGKRLKVHLDCNTGMNRYGARPDEIGWLTQLILSYKNLQLEGVMSHLADSDGEDQHTVTEAVTIFDKCVETVRQTGGQPSLVHIAQSAGLVKAHSKYANVVRPGIALYGINPFAPSNKMYQKLADLKPALKFISTITKINQLKRGEKVSYNYTFTAPKAVKIGVIPVGYYEGLKREFSNLGVVKIGKKFAPIVGNVNMNHTMLNLDGLSAKVGSEVVVYSNNPHEPNSVQYLSDNKMAFNYSLLTGLSDTTKRILVD
jgi:alanine racemase